MAIDVDLQQEIFNKTLEEAVHDDEDGSASPCVICLDSIHDPCITVPCQHNSFDVLCLVSWLEQRRACPLCKSEITALRYDLRSPQGPQIYNLPSESSKSLTTAPPLPVGRVTVSLLERGDLQTHPTRTPYPGSRLTEPEDPLTQRRHIYRHQLYSLRVGSNRLSRYRELAPQLLNRDEDLVSRARKWIRRELRVFEFLNPDIREDEHRQGAGRAGEQRLVSRRANNAEFLLEYIIAILRTVDIKGSAGQAEELLQEFIGRRNARLFLHELQSWLRSPYTSLSDWDRNVQYKNIVPGDSPTRQRDHNALDRRSTPIYLSNSYQHSGRVSKPYLPGRGRRLPKSCDTQTSRIQYARHRYQPD